MGQKVNPKILRIGTVYNWDSRWFNERNYKGTLLEDYKLRKAIMEKLKFAGVASVEIERSINSVKLIINVSKPGMVIGRAGTGLEDLKKFINAFFRGLDKSKSAKQMPRIDLRVEGVKEPNLNSFLVAKNVAEMLQKRLPFKRVLNSNSERVMGAGAKGVRIVLSGRINGSEIGRREKIQVGKVPLSTIREDIDYSSYPSLTKKGYIGVKVWINKPEEKGR
ncbi:MAG TPA: 30S ribosomal protein S3 [Patescibacteria group bacterium]|nr:30S ribosomal protein S3 [Patescibacteria group bacterium]